MVVCCCCCCCWCVGYSFLVLFQRFSKRMKIDFLPTGFADFARFLCMHQRVPLSFHANYRETSTESVQISKFCDVPRLRRAAILIHGSELAFLPMCWCGRLWLSVTWGLCIQPCSPCGRVRAIIFKLLYMSCAMFCAREHVCTACLNIKRALPLFSLIVSRRTSLKRQPESRRTILPRR
jgi:hypothetical protein